MEDNSKQTPQKKQKWFINRLQDAIKHAGKRLMLTDGAKYYLTSLGSYADADGYCYPTQPTVLKDWGVSLRSQKRYIKILNKIEVITIKRKYDKGKRMTRNYYTVHIDAILALSIDENGEIISELKSPVVRIEKVPQNTPQKASDIAAKIHTQSGLNDGRSNSEPTDNLALGSKIVRPSETHTPRGFETLCSTIEPSAKLAPITTPLKTTKEPLYIVHQKTVDDKKISTLPIAAYVGFDEFWLAYPRKEKKKEAYKIWVRDKLSEIAEKILTDIHRRKADHDRWADIAYIPMPTTYLNGEQWEDQIVERIDVSERSERRKLTPHQQAMIDMTNEYEEARSARNGKIS